MAKLAITGVTGKSGQYLWQEILNNQEKIKKYWPEGISLISRNSGNFDKLEESGLQINHFIGDLSDKKILPAFCEGCDTLLHIAGIHWSLELVKVAVKSGIKRIILVHTTGIYSKYKSAGEEYRNIDSEIYKIAESENLALTILRPTMIYGDITDNNVVIFIKMIDKFMIMPTVNGARYELQPVHCGDLGKAYYDVLIRPEICNNKDYVLSGGAPIELRQMFDEIAKNLGVKRKYISCPYPIAYIGAWIIFLLTFAQKDYREKVQRLVEPRVYDYKDAAKDFGYSPRTFEVGIVDEVEQYLKTK